MKYVLFLSLALASVTACPPVPVEAHAECLSEPCTGSECDDKVKEGFCFIDNECYVSEQTMPGDLCRWCEPEKSQRFAVGRCGSGQSCSVDGMCLEGDATGADTASDIGSDTPSDSGPSDTPSDQAPDSDNDVPAPCTLDCTSFDPNGQAECAFVGGVAACVLVGCDDGYATDGPDGTQCLGAATCTPCGPETGCATGFSCKAIGTFSYCVASCANVPCGAGEACVDWAGGSSCLLETGGCAVACTTDSQCEDTNACTDGACVAGTCQFTDVPPGTLSCYQGPDGTEGVGPCIGGSATCVAGVAASCDGQVLPAADVCGDGIDNDCDGTVDGDCEIIAVDLQETNAVLSGTGSLDGAQMGASFGPTPTGPPPTEDAPIKVEFGLYPIDWTPTP